MTQQEDELYMRRCIEIAQYGIGYTAPNPMVGAVIVRDGKVIGEGWHRKYGEVHAEVNAVRSVKDEGLLKDATIYVCLEPCAHYGKTPPCANLLVEKGFGRVVISNDDPFPKVNGRGIEILQNAGIQVTRNVLKEEGYELNRRFFSFHTYKRPYVILKWAKSSDGYMGRRNERVTISNEETLRISHKLRAEESSILVGTQTALTDNPTLTVRHWTGNNPIRILIDRELKVPSDSNIFNDVSKTIVITEKEPYVVETDAEYVVCRFIDNKLVLSDLMAVLYNKNIQSLIVEGGSETLNSFINEGIWDEIRVETNAMLELRNGVAAPSLPDDAYLKDTVKKGDSVIRTYRKQKI